MNELMPRHVIVVPWTLRDIATGVAAWLVLLISSTALMNFLNWPKDTSLVVILGESTLFLPVWYFTLYKYGASWESLGLRTFHPLTIGLGCGLMVLFVAIHLVYALILDSFDLTTQPGLDQIFQHTGFPPLLFFGVAILAPFVEELFFRGFIFMGLRDKIGGVWAILISASFFALVHVVPTVVLPIFLLGVIFALLAHVSGSIWPPIFIHILNNSLALAAAYWDNYYHWGF